MKYADMTEEQKEKRRQYMREYYQTHREACKLAAKRWRIKNPGMRTGNNPEYNHQYWIRNKERLMQKRHEKNQPKMVRVVRCKDCKHWTKEEDKCLEIGMCRVYERRFTEDWFCADGEKRTDKKATVAKIATTTMTI